MGKNVETLWNGLMRSNLKKRFDEEADLMKWRGILANKNKVRPLNLNIGDKVIFHTYDSIYSKDITVPIREYMRWREVWQRMLGL